MQKFDRPDWVYLDHASTACPKAPGIAEAITGTLSGNCASPGRGAYALAARAERAVWKVRERVAEYVGASMPEQIIFTAGATESLNLALHGFLSEGDHVVVSTYDHNAVLRPLAGLRTSGITFSAARFDAADSDVAIISALDETVTKASKMVVINHASNVTGEMLPVELIGAWAHKHGLRVLLDASQSFGHVGIKVEELPVDMMAFGGHKGLRGPFGIGCLVVRDLRLPLKPFLRGGTGLESENLDPRPTIPTAFEAGTLNISAIAGLGAALSFGQAEGAQVSLRALELAKTCAAEFRGIDRVVVYGTEVKREVPNVAFNIVDFPPAHVAHLLDSHYRIAARAGLHCAPLIHDHLGTSPLGSVRVSFGMGNTDEHAGYLVDAVRTICGEVWVK